MNNTCVDVVQPVQLCIKPNSANARRVNSRSCHRKSWICIHCRQMNGLGITRNQARISKPVPLLSLDKKEWKSVYKFYIRQYIPSEPLEKVHVQRHSVNFSLKDVIYNLTSGSKSHQASDLLDKDLELLMNNCQLVEYENSLWMDVERVKLIHYFPHIVSQENRMVVVRSLRNWRNFL